MGLEAATYISGLVASNPVHLTDGVSEGDDHLRLIKSTLLNTFPSITGAVSLTHTQLNNAAIKSESNTFTLTQIIDGGDLSIYGGGLLRVYNAGETAQVSFQHTAGDLNIVGSATTDINITGITSLQAGTVDADFDAITATSYGGIAEANLLDKSASETISGATWNFQAITATSFGGIASANLLDKSATETVSGAWTFSSTINGNDPDNWVDKTEALSFTYTTASQPGYVGTPQRSIASSDSLALTDAGKCIRMTGGSGQTLTIPANASVAFPVGTVIEVINDSGNNWSIASTTDTLEWLGIGGTGTRTLQDNNKCILEKVSSTLWKISGTAGLA